jgi:hypothetical protein
LIGVEYNPDLNNQLRDLRILPQQLVHAVNVRHRGLVTKGFDRLIALHWFRDDIALLVESKIVQTTRTQFPTAFSKRRIALSEWIQRSISPKKLGRIGVWLVELLSREKANVRFHRVVPALAVWLQPEMPGGTINRESTLYAVLETVARSFGVSVTCHADRGPRYLYSGCTDGKLPRLTGGSQGDDCYLGGTYFQAIDQCELVWSLNLTRYMAWYRRTLARKVREISEPPTELMIRAQEAVLEQLLTPEWLAAELAKKSTHPACKRIIDCRAFRARGGSLRIPSELKLVHEIAEIIADNVAIVECTLGDRNQIEFGSLANCCDDAVIKSFRGEASTPSGFGGALLELSCAASHLREGRDVQKIADRAMPDLEIKVPGWPMPVFAECKCITGVGKHSVKNEVKKANQQLRSAGVVADNPTGYGVVYVDISERVGFAESSGEEILAAVKSATKDVEAVLRNKCRSVSAVVLLWKEHSTLRRTDQTLVLATWKSTIYRHAKAHVRLPADSQILAMSRTVGLVVIPDGKGQSPQPTA